MDAYRKLMVLAAAFLLAMPAMATSVGRAETMPLTVEKFDPNPPTLRRPEPGSWREKTLAALDDAQTLSLYSLQPWFYEPGAGGPGSEVQVATSQQRTESYERSREQWCREEVCFHQTRVLGRVEVTDRERGAAETALREALGQVPRFMNACVPEYRHAIGFVSDGKRYEVLLCYQCGQIMIAVDGVQREDGQAASMGDLEALHAIFRRAGIPLARRSW